MEDMVLVTGGNDVKLWQTDGSHLTLIDRTIFYGSGTPSLCWSTDNQYLAGCSSSSEQIIIKQLPFSNEEIIITGKECLGKTCVSFDHSNNLLAGGKNGIIHTWDIKNRKIKGTYVSLNACITALQHSYADPTFAVGLDNGSVTIYRKRMDAFNLIPSPNKSRVSCLRFNPFHSNILAASSDDGSVYMFDVTQKELCHSFKNSHTAPISCLAFSTVNKNVMISAGLDKKIFLYDIKIKSLIWSISCYEKPMSIDIHPNGYTLVVGTTRGQLVCYDLRQHSQHVDTQHAHDSSVFCLRFQNKIAENKPKSKIPTTEKSSLPKAEGTYPPCGLKDISVPIDSNDDIFSPFKSEGIESKRDSRQSIDALMMDSIVSESSAFGVTSTIFSPLATSSAVRQPKADLNTPSKIETSFTQIFGNTPGSHLVTEGTPLKDLPSLLIPPEELFSEGLKTNSFKLCTNMSLENLTKKADGNLVGTTSSLDSLPIELLRKVVREEVEDCFERLHKGFLNLHVEMIKKFHEQQEVIQQLLQSSMHEPQLLNEIKHLQEENALLKKYFK